MIDKQIILSQILGEVDLNFLIASWIVAILGGTLNAILYARRGIKRTDNDTPSKFDIFYFLRDNSRRFISGMILLFVYARFGQELIGQTLTLGLAFLIGFSIDWVMVYARKKFYEIRTKFFPASDDTKVD